MMTLREFVEKVNCREHFRVYQPNRDCLIYESFFKVHSPYFFNEKQQREEGFNVQYYADNKFCDDVRLRSSYDHDEETRLFLEKFGDYEVFGIECSSFKPCDILTDANGKIHINYYDGDPLRPGAGDWIPCFNIFIG